jgi:hypothetical protein
MERVCNLVRREPNLDLGEPPKKIVRAYDMETFRWTVGIAHSGHLDLSRTSLAEKDEPGRNISELDWALTDQG